MSHQNSRSVVFGQLAALRALGRIVRGAGLALIALALTVGGLILAERGSAASVLHQREVSRLARTALTLAIDQETGLRGFLLTRDSASLGPDVAARAQLGLTLDSLVAETRGDSVQHAHARAIRDAIERWENGYRAPLLGAIASGVPVAALAADSAHAQRGRALFDTIRLHDAAFLSSEESVYRARVHRDHVVAWSALGAGFVEVLALLALVRRVGRQARAQTMTVFDQQAQLEMQAVQLEEQAVELEAQTEELAGTLEGAQASEARFRSVVETAQDAIITSDADGRILHWNAAATAVYGYASAEAVGLPLCTLVPERRRDHHVPEYAALVAGRAPHLAGAVVRDAQRKDGSIVPVELSVSRWEAGGEVFVTSIVRDITARVALESRLVHQASHDALTGLANRACFRDHLAAALARDPAHPERVAVLFLDLDDFKAVNDTAGHAAGDRVLRIVAERLLSATRGSDTVARLGGDEFGLLLGQLHDASEADLVADRLVRALREPIALGDREVAVEASIGIARGAPTLDADALVRNADTAMYAAKESGKGGARWFAPAMHDALVERAQTQGDIGPALERGEFWLAYQPIVALDDGRVHGLEALLRWRHPRRGELSPATFIPVAEASGQIVALGRWVLGEACRAVAAMPDAPYVTVNLSARQLTDPSLVADVADALGASGIAPERLVLEITETVLMADTTGMLRRLGELKALGVRLAIDDFGTGYSSLRYLQRFPVDVLKIDKSFVDRVDTHDHDAALVRTIVALGEMLGLTTVAEGIERAAQRERLGALGCAHGQGYHFARPLDAAAAAAFLARAHAIA